LSRYTGYAACCSAGFLILRNKTVCNKCVHPPRRINAQ
jgi:hypothetical protein